MAGIGPTEKAHETNDITDGAGKPAGGEPGPVPALAQSSSTGIEFQSTRHQIPTGTTVKVKLLQNLSSSSAESGQRVRVQVAGDDSSGLPSGAVFNGWVAVGPARDALKTAGVLRLKFGGEGGQRLCLQQRRDQHGVGPA